MLALDEQGYLKKTHTSSGRIPTEKAYQHYVDYDTKPAVLLERQKQKLQEAMEKEVDERAKVKGLLRTMADLSDEFILTAFAENDFYYTGLTNLFSKPEFSEQEVVCNVSAIIDHLDSRLKLVFNSLGNECHIFVGKNNPIDSKLSFIAVKVANDGPLVALLGPMRMRYSANVALVEYCRELLS
jgi:heat-inducible transcriptional repressor